MRFSKFLALPAVAAIANVFSLVASAESSVVAETSNAATNATSGGGNWLANNSGLIVIAIFAIAMYFFMIRPQKKQAKEKQNMLDAIKVGDTVTTIGGIVGTVVKVEGENVVVKSEDSSLTFKKWAVRDVSAEAIEDDVDDDMDDGDEDETEE